LLPEGITGHLTAAQLEAIIAHEMCHVRRRDNLTAALHMAVEAIFWFHPLVWWLGARLVEERERSCDEEVLRLGSEPQIYAESILKTCQFYLESPLACVSGITGSDLKKRIVRIMTEGLEKKLSFWHKFLLATVGVVALAAPIVLGLMNAPQSRAQSQPANIAAPSFEVASVKVNNGGGGWPQSLYSRNGRFVATNISLKSLLQMAYGLKDSQIAEAPSWTNTEKYDIEAKPDDAVIEALQKLTSPEKFNGQVNLMIQSLIRDRFKLASHYETKELPVYVLLVARNGPKFHEAAITPTGSTPPNPRGPSSVPPKGSYIRMGGRGQLDAVDANLDMFIDVLSQQIGRIILNQTGLKAKYDFTLKWTPDEGHPEMFKGAGALPSEAAPPPDTSGPTIFTAMQEQLGLKLEAQKSSMPVLIVDHIERPTEN
jgi:bla regulator protein BlaR1